MTLLLALSGCVYDEHLPQVDVHGTLVIPREAATRVIAVDENGEPTETLTDVRFIGPVYIGAFPDVREGDFTYPHPEMGPVLDASLPGNAYPYGGGTVGRFDFACFEHVACKVTTGRFRDYDDLLGWFRDVVKDPIVNDFGSEIQSPDYYRSFCYELLEITSDAEMSWISNDDLSFVENSDGDFEAEFSLWQVTYQQNMKVWGFMDSPGSVLAAGEGRFSFSTCDNTQGQSNNEYVADYFYGAGRRDVLNYPSQYIGAGDWVSGMDDVPTLTQEDADAFRDAQDEGYSVDLRIGFEVQ